jgi:tetratricopeptide (TPR) repeat protein
VYPADYRNYLRLGLLYSKIPATLARAASMLEIAASKAGKDKTVWLEIAKVYGQLGNEAKELSAYRKYIEADPQNLDANIRIGSILVAKNNFSEGLIYLETANTLSPNNIKIMVPLAKGYLATNRDKEALSILKKAKELKPDDPEIRKSLYKTYLKVGEKKAAADEIKELVKTSKDQGLLLLYAGLLLEDGKLKEAQDAIEDIRAVNPENIEALMLLAKVQRANKKYDDAIETYKEVLYINANYAPALYERAETHMLQNKPQWAEKFYDRAIRTDPKMGVAELGLAKVFRLRKDNAGYVEHLKKAQQISPDNPEIKAECKQAGL